MFLKLHENISKLMVELSDCISRSLKMPSRASCINDQVPTQHASYNLKSFYQNFQPQQHQNQQLYLQTNSFHIFFKI